MTDRGCEDFWGMHARARSGRLDAAERREYERLRDAFLRATTDAQNAGLVGLQAARATPRVRRAVQVELVFPEGAFRTMTFDVGLGGFSALGPATVRPGTTLDFSLQLGRALSASGRARVVARKLRVRDARLSLAYEALSCGESDLQAFVLDALRSDLLPGSQFLEDVSGFLSGEKVVERRITPCRPVRVAEGPPVLRRVSAR